MPQEPSTTIPVHIPVDYDDGQHRYYLGNRTYTSATQLLDRFKNKFDTGERSQYMADRYGEDAQYWKDKWDETRDAALDRGNRIHKEQEDLSYGRGVEKTVAGLHLPVQNRNLLPESYPLIELPDGVYPELKLWRHDFGIAGRADKITLRTYAEHWAGLESFARDYEQINNALHEIFTWGGTPPKKFRFMDVGDYKTNKRVRKESFYKRNLDGTKSYKMMKGPISHLMDCEWIHYALQFSLYQYMGEYHGFLPGTRTIIHHQNPDMFDGLLKDLPGEFPVVVEELPYLRDEVIAMLNHLKHEQTA